MNVEEKGARSAWFDDSWFDAVPALAAIALMVAVLRGFAQRIRYPYDLEWMEGGMLAHAWRLLQGLPLYPEAGPEWVPYVYPPGYTVLLAALSLAPGLGGLDYWLGRALSIAGTLGVCAAIAFILGRRGSFAVGFVVAACFLGCWRASGAFYDLVRPDALGTALLAWSLAFVLDPSASQPEPRPGWGRWRPVIAGLLLALAFTVKHHSAMFGFPLLLIVLLREGRQPALRFVLSSAVPAGLFTLSMQLLTSGRFLDYLLAVPASHPFDVQRMWPGVPGELGSWLLPGMVLGTGWLLVEMGWQRSAVPAPALYALPSLFGTALAVIAWYKPEVRGVDMPPLPVLVLSAGCIGAGLGASLSMVLTAQVASPGRPSVRWWGPFLLGGTALLVVTLMRGHNGGFLNVLMPAHLAICLGFGWAILGLRAAFPGAAMGGVTSLLLLIGVSWVGLRLEVEPVLPTEADAAAGDTVVERLKQCAPGPIFSPYAAWMPVQAGREPSPHLIALWDINHPRSPFLSGVEDIKAAARAHRWSCVLQGGRTPLGFGVDQNYKAERRLPLPGKALMPKTGWRVRPDQVLVPR